MAERNDRGREARPPRYDFHSHTFLSDGRASPADMWSAAEQLGHRLLAITDHVSMADPTALLRQLAEEARGWEESEMTTLVGVEISKVPPAKIGEIARRARRAGAEIVIVHGETLMEPVPVGTNHAALESNAIDLLAHPGLLTEEDAELAKAHEVVLELSGRRLHGITNGHVAQRAAAVGAHLVVDSDAHDTHELIPAELALRIAAGAGITESRVPRILDEGARHLIKRCGKAPTSTIPA